MKHNSSYAHRHLCRNSCFLPSFMDSSETLLALSTWPWGTLSVGTTRFILLDIFR